VYVGLEVFDLDFTDSQAPTPFLDGKHTIFGRISSGMKTVQRLEAVRTDNNDRPVEDIKIHKARLGEAQLALGQ
jgi:peptidyl-prolyl cis-trans isomerase-like 1